MAKILDLMHCYSYHCDLSIFTISYPIVSTLTAMRAQSIRTKEDTAENTCVLLTLNISMGTRALHFSILRRMWSLHSRAMRPALLLLFAAIQGVYSKCIVNDYNAPKFSNMVDDCTK